MSNASATSSNARLNGRVKNTAGLPRESSIARLRLSSIIGPSTKPSSNSAVDVGLALFFGLLGYLFIKLDCEPAPLLLGFVLGPMMEDNLRRAMLISRGNPAVFFTRPLSLGLLIVALALLVVVVLPAVRKKREEAFQE